MKPAGQPLQLHSDGIKAKRVVRTSRIRPDMPRHEFEVVGQFTSNGGAATPFATVLRQVDDISNSLHGTNHETRGTQCLTALQAKNFNYQTGENFNPERGEV